MRDRIDTHTVELPPVLEDLTDESFFAYLTWLDDAARLKSVVIDPFSAVARGLSNFSKDARPTEATTETVFDRGGRKVTVKSNPVNSFEKKTTYDRLCEYVDDLIRSQEAGEARDGIDIAGDEAVVEVGVLRKRYELLRSELAIQDLKQEVGVEAPVDLVESMDIALHGRSYDVLNEMNADTYARARLMLDEGESRTNKLKRKTEDGTKIVPRFKQLLKSDLLAAFGRPEYKQYGTYGIAGPLFTAGIKPQTRAEYAEVLEDLFKPLPKVLKTNSRIGILTIVESMEDEELFARIQQKGLVSQDLITLHASRSDSGKASVSLYAFREFLNTAKAHRTALYEEVTLHGNWRGLASHILGQ